MDESILLRFINKIRFTDTCWIWTASTTKRGYPKFKLRSYTLVLSHRQAYEWWVGPLVPSLTIDHVKEVCNNIKCVNPDHLEQVTRVENSYRQHGVNAIHCKNGHLRSEWTRSQPSTGKKYCIKCARLAGQMRYDTYKR
jgi:hypothetical protein